MGETVFIVLIQYVLSISYLSFVFLVAVGIGQNKVELALLQVGTSHLDTHGITKLIFVVVPASSQAEVALVESA